MQQKNQGQASGACRGGWAGGGNGKADEELLEEELAGGSGKADEELLEEGSTGGRGMACVGCSTGGQWCTPHGSRPTPNHLLKSITAKTNAFSTTPSAHASITWAV